MEADLQNLYQRTVLEHCRSPRNFHVIEPADRVAEGFNPLCGDKVTVYLRESPALGKEGILPSFEGGTPSLPAFSPPTCGSCIAELSFQASGCAICLASASMMTELLGGKGADEARRHADRVLKSFHAGAENGLGNLGNLGDIVALGSVRAYPSRIRCVTLPWRTFIAALDSDLGTVSTE